MDAKAKVLNQFKLNNYQSWTNEQKRCDLCKKMKELIVLNIKICCNYEIGIPVSPEYVCDLFEENLTHSN